MFEFLLYVCEFFFVVVMVFLIFEGRILYFLVFFVLKIVCYGGSFGLEEGGGGVSIV